MNRAALRASSCVPNAERCFRIRIQADSHRRAPKVESGSLPATPPSFRFHREKDRRRATVHKQQHCGLDLQLVDEALEVFEGADPFAVDLAEMSPGLSPARSTGLPGLSGMALLRQSW